jgi:hypothetical protein
MKTVLCTIISDSLDLANTQTTIKRGEKSLESRPFSIIVLKYPKARIIQGIWNHEGISFHFKRGTTSLLLTPLILFANLLFFTSSEIILYVESLSDLLGCLPFDHVCYSFACHIQQTFDIQVVGSL